MDVSEQVRIFEEFFEKNYLTDILEKIRIGQNYLVVDFLELTKFNPEISQLLLDQPEEILKTAEIAIRSFDLPDSFKNFYVRFFNLPLSQKIAIRAIRSEHLEKFIFLDGTVRQKSDVRPQVTSARFECPSCGNVITVLQLEQKFKEPTRCGCGRKGKFRLLSKELVDAQKIVLEELAEQLDGGQPKRIDVFLKNDLVCPLSDKKTNPGTKVQVVGQLKEVPIPARDGGQLIRYDLMVEVNHILTMDEDYGELKITDEEKKEILELSRDPKILLKLTNSIAPSIYGHDKIKEAIVLQILGGVHKTRKDGVRTRGDMHILLIGDPGSGKCLEGNTKLVMGTGEIKTIKEIVESKINENVFSINHTGNCFDIAPSRFWKRKISEKLFKIKTKTGNELLLTKQHPLFTTNHGLINSKTAAEFNIGEYIAQPSNLNVFGELQQVPIDFEKVKSFHKTKYNLPTHIGVKFARLLGYLVGDGYVRQRKTTGLVSITNNDFDLLNRFEHIIHDLFGIQVSKRKKQNSNSYEYYFCSRELVNCLEKIDKNITKGSGDMLISKYIQKSPDFVLKEFISALFDCEGYVNKNKREIEFSSKSKNLIVDLKLCLLRFGITTQSSECLKHATNTINKIKRKYHRLKISGENIKQFSKTIGFGCSKKQTDLKKSIELNGKFNTNLNIVPNISELLIVLRHTYGLTQKDFGISRTTYQHYERGDRNPSFTNLKKINLVYQNLKNKFGLVDDYLAILDQISNADIFWDQIESIEEVKNEEKYVYDLEIPKVHNFIANGVMVHNSQLIKRAQLVAPKSRYVSGKGASGAGLTAAVVKDEFMRGWALEAGALVLANKGFCMIDELDKMSTEDRSAMHEALEQQTVTIAKANIQATLRAETTVLAAANPKWGRFDPYEIIAKQINLPPALISRFDLIFPVRDLPDRDQDSKLAAFILNLHKNKDAGKAEIDTDQLRKYLSYSRRYCKPELTKEALEEIQKYYVEIRNKGGEDGGVKSIPITARQLEALVRLAEASARSRLAEKVTRKDAKKAIELLHYCMVQVGVDPETGKIDIDVLTTGVSSSARNNIAIVKESINELENKIGKTIPIEELVKEVQEKGIDVDKVDEVIEKLKRSGDIFEPRRGFIQKI
ncbi:helix-turn-helix domain-containing protein [Candidatus Woesearchaeota archaeon]|nr:helix-turn-helix domain-containing protein [Candidatus Woesearchaeota archaeon]